MGVSVYALEADTGRLRWMNDGVGALPTTQPHGGRVLAALAPQGYLALSGDTLLVPNSRSLPEAMDRHSGVFRYLDMARPSAAARASAASPSPPPVTTLTLMPHTPAAPIPCGRGRSLCLTA